MITFPSAYTLESSLQSRMKTRINTADFPRGRDNWYKARGQSKVDYKVHFWRGGS